MPLAKLLRSGDVASGVLESETEASQTNQDNSEQVLTELSGLLGSLVPSLFRDGSGALDFSKIPAKSFEEFLSFLKTQVAVNDGSWFSDPYVGVVGREEYRPLLEFIYHSNLANDRRGVLQYAPTDDLLKKFESDLIRINAEKFVQQHLSSKQGRTHLRHILGDITHFTKSERGQVLNAIAAVSRQEHKILENHLDGIKNHTLYWGSLNVFQSDEEIAKATLGANIVLDAVEVEEEYTASREKYLEKRSTQDEQMDYMVKLSKEKAHTPIVEAEVHLAKMWLMVADEERWSALMNQDSTRENDEKSKKEWGLDSSRPSIQTNKIRKWLFEQIKNHFEWIKAIRAESDPKKAEALFEQFSKNLHNTFHGDVHLNGFSNWEITKDYIRSSTTGLTLSTLLEEIPKSQKKEFEAIFQLTDRWHYAQKYGEKIFDGSKSRGVGSMAETTSVGAYRPTGISFGHNTPLRGRRVQEHLIQTLTEANQNLWVGYAGRGTFSRSLSFFADTINSTGDKATIHKASDFIKTRIQNIEKSETAEDIQIEIEKIFTEAKSGGILNRAFHASSSEGLEALLNLAETCIEYAATTAATRGLGALKAAKTVKDLKAVVQSTSVVQKSTRFTQVSKWAAEAFPKAKDSFKMGMLTSTEGMILQNLSDQSGREDLTLKNIGIQGLSEAISMAVMGLVPEKEAAQILFKNKIQQAIYSVARNVPQHTVKESIEEISSTLLQQAMKDPSQPLSEEEILNTIKLCAVSGGLETKALLKAISFNSHDTQRLSNFLRHEVKPIIRDFAVRTAVLGMNGGIDDEITKSIIEEAQSPSTDSKRLDILSTHPDERVRRKVAENPATPLETLLKLSNIFPEEVVSNSSFEIYLLSDPLLYNRLSFSGLLCLAQRLEKEDNSIKVKLIGNAILSQWLNNITISLSSMEANIIFPVLQIKCDALLNRLILTTDRTILQTVARNFFLSEDQLSYLSNCTFPPIRALVAAHPNLGVETIRKLSDDKSSSVRTAIVKHPKISHELLERFSQDKDIDVRIAVARHSNTTAEILSRLMNDPDEKVRAAVARNPNTSSADLDLLSQDSNREVKSAADSNPGIRFERLSKISAQGRVSIAANEKNLLGLALLENDSEIEVRKALVLNPHLPLVQVIRMKEKGDLFFRQHMAAFIHLPEVLDVLGNDPDLTVRKNVISNGHTSLETLTRMTQTSDSQMRRYIAIHVRFPEILDSLGNDPDPEVRKNVISKWHTSLETLTRMTQDSDLQIRRHIALHVRFPEILDILGDDLDHEVRRNVLSNAHVTLKTFRKTVLGVEPESRRYIAWQTKNNEILAILSSDPDLEVKERVADNRNTSLETLKRMTQDSDSKLREHMAWRSENQEILDLLASDPDTQVKERVADNKNTSLETLKRMTQDPDSKLREHMAWRSESQEILDLLASDPDSRVKEWVVDNRNTSLETLNRMRQDPDPKLRRHMEWRKK